MSKKLKVCIIYNGAPHYRMGIFKLIDEEYDCDWYFGKGYGNIKQLPLSFFKKAHLLPTIRIKGGMIWQEGLIRLLLSKKFEVFFILGDITNVSIWCGLILHNVFNRRKKIYYWTHGMLRMRKQPRQLLNHVFFNLPYGIFVYGDRAKNLMIGQGYDSGRIFVIHNSLDYEGQLKLRGHFTNIYKEHFGNNVPVLFFIGRLTTIKRLDMLITSIDILRKKSMYVNLVFIGNGLVMNSLKEQVHEMHLDDQVWFYGACYNEEEKSELISNADICVAPGNIGLTAMDSLMYGTPAITMDNFDMQMPEHEAIKDGITGTFYKENDVQDLSDTIFAWLNKGYDREQIRQNCYKEIDTLWNPKFQIEVIKMNLKP